ncbi:MAG: hypothetical protein FJW34_20830 [Acidobacteria bacterium]|nr:hypothetical protein [Acidobacteriota bacterium]
MRHFFAQGPVGRMTLALAIPLLSGCVVAPPFDAVLVLAARLGHRFAPPNAGARILAVDLPTITLRADGNASPTSGAVKQPAVFSQRHRSSAEKTLDTRPGSSHSTAGQSRQAAACVKVQDFSSKE